MKKRCFSLVLVLCLCVGFFSAPATAAWDAIPEESDEYEALEHFLMTFAWWREDYDAEANIGASQGERNILWSMLSEGPCYTDSIYPGPNREEVWNFDGKKTDPLGKFASYAKVSITKIDWVLKNIFNCSTDSILTMKAALGPRVYTYDEFYYIEIGGIGGDYDVDILDIVLSGKRYYVTYNVKNIYYDDSWTKYYAIFELKNIDSKNYWSIYYNKKLINGEEPNIPESTSPTPTVTGSFSDISQDDYFYNAVRWGVEQKIVSGTSINTFSPNDTCTRAQILTFLWRANGSPEPTEKNPFNDILEGRYYYKAALWAYEKGLTGLLPHRTFGPDEPCTRAMTVTYLWKLVGKPVVEGSAFSDVLHNEEYAYAVAWAVTKGITGGTSNTTFSPNAACTRAQIITFLYRNAGYDTLTPPQPNVGSTEEYSSWNEAYKDFVCNEKFLTIDFPYWYIEEGSDWGDQPPWGTDYTPTIALRDLDSDGIPELIIENGHAAALDRDAYIYTFASDKTIVYLGNCMLNARYLPNSQYSGVFCDFYAGAGMGSTSYYWKDGNTIQHELVYSYERDFNGEHETRMTDDDTLYYGARNSTVSLYSATAEEIASMGWNAFVSKALG